MGFRKNFGCCCCPKESKDFIKSATIVFIILTVLGMIGNIKDAIVGSKPLGLMIAAIVFNIIILVWSIVVLLNLSKNKWKGIKCYGIFMSLMLFISIVILIVGFIIVIMALSEIKQETDDKKIALIHQYKVAIIMLWVGFIIALVVMIWELHIAIGVVQSAKYLEDNNPSYEEMDNLYGQDN